VIILNIFKSLERKDKIKIIATFCICLVLIIGVLIPIYKVRQIGLGEVVPTVENKTQNPYGTPYYYIQYYMKDDKDFAKIYSHYYDVVHEFHGDSDRYHYYNDLDGNLKNNLRTINESYGSGEEIVVSQDLFNVLKIGVEFTKLSKGKFNLLIGELSSFWNDNITYLKEKVDAGVDFLTTQMFFDNNILYNFLYRIRERGITVPVVAGIMPVTSGKQIARSCQLSGTYLPARFKTIVDKFGDNPEKMKQAGIAYATEQIIDLIANGVKGIHIYTMNKPDVAQAIRNNLSHIIGADQK
jgi:hypothetical protein